MKPYIPLVLLWVCPLFLHSQQTPKTLSSEIKQVTVFLNGAQIQRTARAQLPTGETSFTFEKLSPYIDPNSIQVQGEGSVTLVSVSHELNYLDSLERRKELVDLQSQQENLKRDSIRIVSLRKVYQREEQMLLKNQVLAGSQSGLDLQTLEAAITYQRKQMQEVLLQQDKYTAELEGIQAKQAQLGKQLKSLREEKDEPTGEITIKVRSKTATQAIFSLNYLVANAGWFSRYDVRVDDISEPLQLEHKAQVFQQSGEDWDKVKLVLSTGNPSESGNAPYLSPWYLEYPSRSYVPPQPSRYLPSASGLGISDVSGQVFDEDGQPLIGATLLFKETTVGAITDDRGSFSLQAPPEGKTIVVSYLGYQSQEVAVQNTPMQIQLSPSELHLEEVEVTGYALSGRAAGVRLKKNKSRRDEVKIRGNSSLKPLETEVSLRTTSTSFEIKDPYSVPSDGKPYDVDIAQHEVETEYEYIAVPKLDTDAFLVARLLDWEELNLVSGEANLFLEGTFMGKSLIDPEQTRDTMSLSLGRDKSVGISRTLKKDFTKRRIIGSNQVESRNWEIRIRNNKHQAISIRIEDQLPLSTDGDIQVKELDLGGAEQEKETGKLGWKLQIEPSAIQELSFSYEVKYPKGWRLDLE